MLKEKNTEEIINLLTGNKITAQMDNQDIYVQTDNFDMNIKNDEIIINAKEKENLTDYILNELANLNYSLDDAINYLEYLKILLRRNTVIKVKKDDK